MYSVRAGEHTHTYTNTFNGIIVSIRIYIYSYPRRQLADQLKEAVMQECNHT